MRWVRAALVTSPLAVAAGACTSIIGLGDLQRVDCVGDACGAESNGDAGTEADARGDATHDGARDDGADAADSAADAAPDTEPPADPGIRCDGGWCKPGVEQCCLQTGACAPAGSCGNAYAMSCDDPDDCATAGLDADVCCQYTLNGVVALVRCTAPGNCQAINGRSTLCNPADVQPCANGEVCKADPLLPGYHACQ